MFGRATIRLGIGPHSSSVSNLLYASLEFMSLLKHCQHCALRLVNTDIAGDSNYTVSTDDKLLK